ncbi:MAG: rhodanese-like domain-containing protein, partial [Devosia sp.]
MSSTTTISVDKLHRLVGTPRSPRLIDVRTAEAFAADPRHIPGAVRRSHEAVAEWIAPFRGSAAVVICQHG